MASREAGAVDATGLQTAIPHRSPLRWVFVCDLSPLLYLGEARPPEERFGRGPSGARGGEFIPPVYPVEFGNS